MGDAARFDRKLKQLAAIESKYRTEIKRAQADLRGDPDRKKHERQIKKWERKMDKLLPRIRRLRELRAKLRE